MTTKPALNSVMTMICCCNGSFSFHTVGMGRMTTMKSVAVLMIPAPSRLSLSEMQVVCGVQDKVQYRDGFLKIRSITGIITRDRRIHTRTEK